jgi:hypothetical protein
MKAICSPKRRLTFNGLRIVISHKTELFITTAVRISNPIFCLTVLKSMRRTEECNGHNTCFIFLYNYPLNNFSFLSCLFDDAVSIENIKSRMIGWLMSVEQFCRIRFGRGKRSSNRLPIAVKSCHKQIPNCMVSDRIRPTVMGRWQYVSRSVKYLKNYVPITVEIGIEMHSIKVGCLSLLLDFSQNWNRQTAVKVSHNKFKRILTNAFLIYD